MNQMVTKISNSKEPFFCCMFFYKKYNILLKNTRSGTSEPSQGCNIYCKYHGEY